MACCIFCGYCELACPFDAITLENEYEMSERTPRRADLRQGDAGGAPPCCRCPCAEVPWPSAAVGEQIVFGFAAAAALVSAVLDTLKGLFRATVALIGTLLSLAVLFVLLLAPSPPSR